MFAADGYDVVVIGFGLAGAAAALEAAEVGARVLVLDQQGVVSRRRASRGAPQGQRSPRGAVRAAARAAGVEVRSQAAAHELLVEGGRIAGVGFASMDPRTSTGARFWWLDRLSRWTPPLSGSLARRMSSSAEGLWHDASAVGSAPCSAVVLAMDRAYWSFVGPAVWAALGSGTQPAGRPRRLSVVPEESASPPTPELAARTWCAAQDGAPAACAGELHVDHASGAVQAGDWGAVPGLFSTVHDLVGLPGTRAEAASLAIAAGRRAGAAASGVGPRGARRHLRSVG